MGHFFFCNCPCLHPSMPPFSTGALSWALCVTKPFSGLLISLYIMMNCFCARKILSLNTYFLSQPLCPSVLLPMGSHWTVFWRSQSLLDYLLRPELSCCCPPYYSLDPKHHDFMLTAATAATDRHIPRQFLFMSIRSSCELIYPLVDSLDTCNTEISLAPSACIFLCSSSSSWQGVLSFP